MSARRAGLMPANGSSGDIFIFSFGFCGLLIMVCWKGVFLNVAMCVNFFSPEPAETFFVAHRPVGAGDGTWRDKGLGVG